MSYIHHNREKIENKCDQVYHTEGMKIAHKLLLTCLQPKYQDAIGLAHNQIGGTKAVFVAKLDGRFPYDDYVDYESGDETPRVRKWRAFINPKITDMSPNTKVSNEGCMTFPNKPNKVERHDWVEVEHQVKARSDNEGEAFVKEKFYGFDAIIVQHECDHLLGFHIHSINKDEENK